jgi:CheY-like chemotaxis protein
MREVSLHTDEECENVQYEILVVDDSKVFNKKISDALTSFGHKITSAFTLKEARKFIEEKKFDFIILDLILPDGEGDQLIDSLNEEIRSRIIVLSGDNDIQRRNYIFETGVLDYFSKNNPTHLIFDDIRKLLCTVDQNSNINILVVDDSAFMRKLLHGILVTKRYNVIEASSAQEGIELLEKNEIHLLLLDYEMPGMDGAYMLEQIKCDIKYLELPVIMLSGNDDKDFKARVLKHGASDFIKKPFISEELILKCDLQVKQYLNVKRLKQKEHDLQIALRKSREAEQHKAMFLANMSHEIRTPLNSIMGFVNLLLEEEKDENKLDHLTTVNKSGEHLLNLINDILDFTKIENNKLDINKEVFRLKELFNLVVSVHKHRMDEKNISFKTIYDNHLPVHFKSDFLRIKQILTNLIGNAIKFTPENGEIDLEVKLSEDKKYIRFSVKDNGIGIEASNHDKVFSIFTQAEDTTTKKFGGTGLGLSICSRLVSLLDGEIGLKSELNKGSEFYFDIPVIEFSDAEVTYKDDKNSEISKSLPAEFDNFILLVEDNLANQKFMSVLLKKLGLTFDIVSDGVEAVDMFKQKEYDLILMDENMPNMCGTEATKIIRKIQREENLKYTPIIALTANAIKGDRDKFLQAGMDEYISKPVNKIKLVEVLSEFLNQDSVFDVVEEVISDNKNKIELPKEFIESASDLIKSVKKPLKNEDFDAIINFSNLLRMASLKFKVENIFTLCLNIKQSAKDKDIQSCKNYVKLIKKMIGYE